MPKGIGYSGNKKAKPKKKTFVVAKKKKYVGPKKKRSVTITKRKMV